MGHTMSLLLRAVALLLRAQTRPLRYVKRPGSYREGETVSVTEDFLRGKEIGRG
jgi:hypothetical protein